MYHGQVFGGQVFGGQTVYYGQNTEQHLNWRPLKQHNMDCGPNCFSLLRYSTWDTSNEMAKRTVDGISGNTVLELLDEAYGPGHEWKHIHNYNQYNGILNRSPAYEVDSYGEPIQDAGHINTYLYPQEATIASIGGEEYGHYFVVLREDGYFAIDAQSGQTMGLAEYIDRMEDKGFERNTLFIVSSPEPTQEANQVTLEMVRRYFPLPKKTRKGSVKSVSKNRSMRKSKTSKSKSKLIPNYNF